METANTDPAATPNNQENNEQTETVTLTAEELQSKLDSEADKRAAKAVETAKAKWVEQQKTALEEAKNQGAKLAQMSAAEKAKQAEKERQEALDAREAELNKRELTANTTALLVESNLPKDLVEPLVALGDAELIKSTTETLQETLQQEVNRRVQESLQSEPPKNGSTALDGADDPFKRAEARYK